MRSTSFLLVFLVPFLLAVGGNANVYPDKLEAGAVRGVLSAPDSTIEQRAGAALPDSVEHLPRASVSAREGGEYDAFVAEIQASYDTGPAMSYLVTVTYFAPDSPGLAKLKKQWARAEPALEVQGHPVYKRAYGGMGSGVGLLLKGSTNTALHTVIQVRSPRLTDAARAQARAEQRSDAPSPEAVLQGMKFSALVSLASAFE